MRSYFYGEKYIGALTYCEIDRVPIIEDWSTTIGHVVHVRGTCTPLDKTRDIAPA